MPDHDPALARRMVTTVRRHGLWLLVALVALSGLAAVGAIVSSRPDTGDVSLPSGPPAQDVHAAKVSAAFPSRPPQPPAPRDRSPTAPATNESARSWAAVARGFGRTFTRTGLGQEAWFAALSSWLTDDQAARYRNVPIADIPTGTLTGVRIDAPGDSDTTGGVLTYDTGMVLEVGLVHDEAAGGWLVATVAPASTAPR
ncbi:hypothetical protein CLV30_104161 [Haloactinopolyspora alba]|uniref:Uncharacterized protein n=1 Tax=Haloactinopolyspora alba TaxID=648780 RepID=A0A2P8E739_9ACTN|nr:hypothetical protein [Haloactinopolyspora alba]PSL05295.1 hypothetical protein CLV30_104161 [Haloactinopolyspora alba]